MFVFVTSLPALTVVICILVTFVQMDTFNFYVVIAQKEIHSKHLIYLAYLIRIILNIVVSQWFNISMKFCALLSLSMAVSFQNVVKIVRNRKLNYTTIFLYKQLIVERNILKSFEQCITSFGLFVMFVLLVLAISGTIIAWKLNRLIIFYLALFLFIFTLGAVVIGLGVCCSTFEYSVKIQNNWAVHLKEFPRYGRLFLRKLVLSCKLLSIPAGYVGIIDNEIKMNYFGVTVDSTINLLISVVEIIPTF